MGTSAESDRANERLERDLTGVMMSKLTLRNMMTFKTDFIARIESMFGDMIQGKDARAELLSNFPLYVDNFQLQWVEPEWIKSFRDPIMEYPRVREGLILADHERFLLRVNNAIYFSLGRHSQVCLQHDRVSKTKHVQQKWYEISPLLFD